MTGHQQLLAMRRKGFKPAGVCVVDGVSIFARDWHEEPNSYDGQFHAEVQIDEHDIPEALDLRFLIGLSVVLVGERGDARARRVFDAICAAKPFVAGTVLSDSLIRFTPEHGKFHYPG
jgi:hypothetical protein